MEWTRRRVLAAGLGGTAAVGTGRAIHNVVLGYGRLTGTNLLEQDLDPLMLANLRPSRDRVADFDGARITLSDWTVRLRADGSTRHTFDPGTDDPADAAAVDEDFGLEGGPLEELVADLGALAAEDVRFEYDSYPAFFERVAGGDARPYAVQALRGPRSGDPTVVADFAGADPTDPESLVEGLKDGFREHTRYDYARYAAGSVEDNVIFGARDLRQHFESETGFEALEAGEDSGLFCTELTRRSVDALQAVPAPNQRLPVVAGRVYNGRHKHVFTVVASAIRDAGELVIPVTFLDYTDAVQYDDLRLRWLVGEGLDAYHDTQRATRITWYR
ncbi:hypothetical protein [Halovivax sp.]|uniref:hypothetical protein n=1 Tax=Halovivax sp. TaxID=1935978 RepID=UPI0025C3BDDB|nr:hypothetical protein [Halovivax sp.]